MNLSEIIRGIKRSIRSNEWKRTNINEEFSCSFGKDNPDKTFFIIRRNYHDLGLFSVFISSLGWIKYAVEKGYIPIIDMQSFPNAYLEDGELGKVNAWEKFFYQPADYTLDDIKTSRNIIYSSMRVPNAFPNDSMEFFNNVNGQLDEWRALCKKYIRLKEEIVQKADKDWEDMFGKRDSVLGVFLRGTDYVKCRFPNHPVQPTSEEVISDVKKVVPERFEEIYLCTEDTDIIENFKDVFAEKVHVTNREFVDYKEGFYVFAKMDRANDAYIKGEEYLRQILVLSRCRNVIISRTSGTVGMALLSDGWDYSHVYDLGRYPARDK